MKAYQVVHRPKMRAAREGAQEIIHTVEAESIIDARNTAREKLISEFSTQKSFGIANEYEATDYVVPRGKEDIFLLDENGNVVEQEIQPFSPELPHQQQEEDTATSTNWDFDIPAYTKDEVQNMLGNMGAGESLVLEDLPNDIYHSVVGLSSTQLKLASQSISLFKWSQDCPSDDDKQGALLFGSAFHAAVLEPHLYEAEYCVMPKFGLTKAEKEAKDYFKAQNAHKTLIKDEDARKIELMRDSVLAHPCAQEVLEHSSRKSELSIFYRDPDTMVILKIRCDALAVFDNQHVIMDLKSISDFKLFDRAIKDFGYHISAAFYTHVYERVFGVTPQFRLAFTSKTIECGKYKTRVGVINPELLNIGHVLFQTALTNIITCSEAGDWTKVEEF